MDSFGLFKKNDKKKISGGKKIEFILKLTVKENKQQKKIDPFMSM